MPRLQPKIKLRLDSNCGFDEIESAAIETVCIEMADHLDREMDWDVSIVFVDHELMISLHREYFDDPGTTDVISFPFSEPGSPLVDGEIYVNVNQALEQAKEYNITQREELLRLIIHGLLHLAGFQDDTGTNRNQMLLLQEQILESVHFLLAPKH